MYLIGLLYSGLVALAGGHIPIDFLDAFLGVSFELGVEIGDGG